MTEQTTFNVPDNVEIFYPEDELKDLKKCMKLQGFLRLASKNTDVSEVTIRKYIKDKKGQSEKVNALRAYVKLFLQKISQPV